MSKNTAVEWLVTELRNQIVEGTLDAIAISKLKMQAKAMEREQIIEAVEAGYQIANEDERFKHISTHGQYYNETYKGGEQ